MKIQVISVTKQDNKCLFIRHFKEDILVKEILTFPESTEALAIGSIIDEYIQKGEKSYTLEVSNDYSTMYYILKDN